MFPDKARLRRLLPRLQTKLKLSVQSREQRPRTMASICSRAVFARFAWFKISFDPFQALIECNHLRSEEAHVVDQAIKLDFDHIGAAHGHRWLPFVGFP